MWGHYPRFGELGMGVRAGALDEPGALVPDAVAFVTHRMPWVALPEGIPRLDADCNPAELLLPERY